MKQNNSAHNGDNHNIPRIGLTIEEAALYSGIGQSTLRELVSWAKFGPDGRAENHHPHQHSGFLYAGQSGS